MKQPDRTQAQPSSARLQTKHEERPLATRPVAPVKPADDYIGLVIDNRYVVEAVIGEGGMGVVYRCRHRVIGKPLALKIIRAEMASNHEATQRFLIEAQAASAIGSEHIIHVSDFGELPDGASYLVMELLDGTSLAAEFRAHWPFPMPRILSITAQLAEGLAAAHRAGIVHRDLKPENIFLIGRGEERDFVKILDFGIAKMSLGNDAQLTRAGTVVGTPRYMSPEQAAGEVVDHRGDIYSLGVLLYELLAGRVPFDGEHPLSILTKHIYEPPPAFAALSARVRVPAELEHIVWKCLAKRPESRYGSMEELASELRELAASSLSSSDLEQELDRELEVAGALSPAGAPEITATLARPRAERRPRRSQRVLTYCALALMLVAVISFWVFTSGEPPRAPAPASLASPPLATVPAPQAPETPVTAAEPNIRRAADPVPVQAPQPDAVPPGTALEASPKAASRPLSKPRQRRDKEQTEFVNPWPARH